MGRVKPFRCAGVPAYPTLREYRDRVALVGTVALGLGLAAGCTTSRTYTPPPPPPFHLTTTGGVIAPEPEPVVPAANPSWVTTGGLLAVEPRGHAAAGFYVVRKGDTLIRIAQQQLGRGDRWHEIVKANPGLKPGHLRVGQKIRLPNAATR
jgi:nucleoid-associated protein YgaU